MFVSLPGRNTCNINFFFQHLKWNDQEALLLELPEVLFFEPFILYVLSSMLNVVGGGIQFSAAVGVVKG
jgi:glycogen synthase